MSGQLFPARIPLFVALFILPVLVIWLLVPTVSHAQNQRPDTETSNRAAQGRTAQIENRNQPSEKSESKRLSQPSVSESLGGSRLSFKSNAPLNDYSAYRDGDRFYIVVPQARMPAIRGKVDGSGFADLKVENKSTEAVLSFRLKPGTVAKVNQRFNQLNVVISSAGNRAQQADSTTRNSRASASAATKNPSTIQQKEDESAPPAPVEIVENVTLQDIDTAKGSSVSWTATLSQNWPLIMILAALLFSAIALIFITRQGTPALQASHQDGTTDLINEHLIHPDYIKSEVEADSFPGERSSQKGIAGDFSYADVKRGFETFSASPLASDTSSSKSIAPVTGAEDSRSTEMDGIVARDVSSQISPEALHPNGDNPSSNEHSELTTAAENETHRTTDMDVEDPSSILEIELVTAPTYEVAVATETQPIDENMPEIQSPESSETEPASKSDRRLTLLAKLGGEKAFKEITLALKDEDSAVRDAAILALFDFKGDRVLAFTRALKEVSADERRNLGAAMASSGLAERIIGQLSGETQEKALEAFSLLFIMTKAGEIAPLVTAIESHESNEVRLAVVKLLALSEHPEAGPTLRRLSQDRSLPAVVRTAVMETIYNMNLEHSAARS